ncbi:MAG: HlyD family secretion protein [Gemmataceae bacterium]
MKTNLSKWALPGLAVFMLVFAVYHVVKAQQTPSKPPPPIEPARTPFGKTVAGAGIVEAETENISIGSPLPGVVWEVYVPVDKVGQIVKPGEPLFRVDTRQLEAQRDYYQANLAYAEAQLKKLENQPRPEEEPPSKAKWDAAEANLALQQDLFQRASKLYPGPVISEEEYRQKKLAVEVARFQAAQAKADYQLLKAGAWQYDKDIAAAAVKQAKAQIKQIQTDIDRSTVCVPKDDKHPAFKVLQVNVLPGQFVGAPPSQALVVLGSIDKMHVRVDIDEHDIPRAYKYFTKEVQAIGSPRGDPSLRFPLTFARVEPYVIPKKSLTGDNTERVDTRVLQVIYSVDKDQPGLYVGMQIDVFLDGDSAPVGSTQNIASK